MTRPLVIGHRGAPGYRPEHTRCSFLLAIEQGVDAIEIDVVPAGDGVLVVRHEHALAETTDVADRPEYADRRRAGPDGRPDWFAEDFTGEELAGLLARERLPALRPVSRAFDDCEHVLRLTDVLELAAEARVLLVIEVKDATCSAALGLDPAALLATELAAEPRLPSIVIESFEKTPLAALAGLGHPLVYLVEATGTAPDERLRGTGARAYRRELTDPGGFDGFAGISLPTALASPRRVDRLHAAGLDVWSWTLRPENRFLPLAYRRRGGPETRGDWLPYWAALLDGGLDAVFTDHPDLAVGLVAARGSR